MVAIDAGSIYITDGSVSGNTISGDSVTVRIDSTKVDYNYDNPVTQIPIPVSSGSRSSKTPYSRAIDLKRIKEVISVQGILADEETKRAITKRDDLLLVGKRGDELTIVWGQGNYRTIFERGALPYGVFINKMMFTETVGIVGEGKAGDAPPERNIAIQIQLVRGKDLKDV